MEYIGLWAECTQYNPLTSLLFLIIIFLVLFIFYLLFLVELMLKIKPVSCFFYKEQFLIMFSVGMQCDGSEQLIN